MPPFRVATYGCVTHHRASVPSANVRDVAFLGLNFYFGTPITVADFALKCSNTFQGAIAIDLRFAGVLVPSEGQVPSASRILEGSFRESYVDYVMIDVPCIRASTV